MLAVLALASLPLAPQKATPTERPHVLVVMVDDLGWRDSAPGAWPDPDGPGARHFRTPHLERLAAEGVRFSDAYASCAVCTPTRTSLMTGSAPARTRITYWTRFPGRDTSAAHPFVKAPAWNVDGLQPGDVTLPALLREAGYRTIHVGKAHWGTGEPTEGTGADPLALGYDVNVAGWAAGAPGSYYGVDDFGGVKRAARRGGGGGGTTWDVPGLERHHGEDVFLTDVLADEAERALREAVASGERVFLHFAPYAVHTPIMANPRVAPRYPDLEGPELAYATLVTSVDDAVGRLLGALDDLGIADETLVVYTSDNGGLSAHGRGGPRARHRHNEPLRSGKGSAYEGGVRVPLVVRWPGVTEAGRVVRGPAITHDLFTTVVSAAGAPIPGSHVDAVDGIDLTPVLAGADAPLRPLVWHMPHFWGIRGPGIEPYSAVRLGDHKLIWFHAAEMPPRGASAPASTGVRSIPSTASTC
ncbi:MAG: sulfatase-like hydrolase/transferase, partial [Planctomycetota bacterium]